jgi:Flp pilus assembly protein TadG
MRTRPVRNESGAAFVEFVAVLPFFLFLIFAMISFGAMFSFRQTLSQAATEGARAAAIAPSNLDFTSRRTRAITAVNEAFQGEPGSTVSCGTGGLTCTIPTTPTTCASTASCISVTLTYAYSANPRLPVPKFFNFTLPSKLTYSASARVQ